MVTPFIKLSLDYQTVVKELVQAGVLTVDHEKYTRHATSLNNETQTWVGLIKFRESKTLVAWLEENSIPADRAAVFVNLPGMLTKWHIDGPHVPCAINFPWFGDGQTITEWYCDEVPEDQKKVIYNTDETIRRIEMTTNDLPATHTATIDGAYLVDISKFHRIDARNSTENRGLISIRFKPGLTFEQLGMKLF